MTLKNLDKAPFPWFGGKSKAASAVWALLGDVPHYVEPFAGSCAVLLGRPHPCNRAYYSETVNDLDGLLVNFWRAIALDPVATAQAASWPVMEADKTARQLALLRWRDGALERLAGDAAYCCPIMAGWWAWGVSVQIGAFDGRGAWHADPETGRLVKQPRGVTREPGVVRDRPHLGDNGRGVNHAGTREPGVARNTPHLADDGRGVNRPAAREPGVARNTPQIGNDGQGVNHAGAREPGVVRNRPHIGNDGRGVNHAGAREPGVLDDWPSAEPAIDAIDWGSAYHDTTMPELVRWFRHLAARLRHVRVINGDWRRACTTGAAHTLPVRGGKGPAGVFLDPPYADTAGRAKGIYASDSFSVAHDVREWCLENGENPKFRIVLAGFEGEHGTALVDAGWREHEWFKAGHLTGGMGNIRRDGTGKKHQQKRERLWSSPHCLEPQASKDDGDDGTGIFGDAEQAGEGDA